MNVSFAAAKDRLATIARGDGLLSASADAYAEGTAGLVRVGPMGSAPGLSKVVRVHFHEVTGSDRRAGLAFRWEVAGRGSELFPALDADLTLIRQSESATLLALSGAYRPPLGAVGAGLDKAIMNRIATATIRRFIRHIADAIVDSSSAPD